MDLDNEKLLTDINNYLNKTKMNQYEFAAFLGCPQSTVSRWLNRHVKISRVWHNVIREKLEKVQKKGK